MINSERCYGAGCYRGPQALPQAMAQKNPEKVKAANDRYWARRAKREAQAITDLVTDEKKEPGDMDA